jgi:hypothetical protein
VVVGEAVAILMEIGHEETEADIARTLDRVYHPPWERNPFSHHLDVTG